MDFKNLKPWLEPEDRLYLESCLKKSLNYLEFGSGGSTLLADKLCKNVTSVETNQEFIKGLLPYCYNTKFIFIDRGEVLEVGYWKNKYISGFQYYSHPEVLTVDPDLILIDGRFRIATLSFWLNRSKAGTRILFDDHRKTRYACLRDYPVPFREIDNSIEFISPEIKPKELFKFILAYENDSR